MSIMKNILRETTQKTLLILMFLFLCTSSAMAQFDNPDEDEDGENEPLDPSASIDDHLIPLLILGVAIGFYLIKSKAKINLPEKG